MPPATCHAVVAALCAFYAVALYGWYTARLALGDSWAPLAALNIFALYLFLPLPLALLAALWTRHPLAVLSGGAALALFLGLYGQLF